MIHQQKISIDWKLPAELGRRCHGQVVLPLGQGDKEG